MIFAQEPWCWPPSVTAEQTIRDLELLLNARSGGGDFD